MWLEADSKQKYFKTIGIWTTYGVNFISSFRKAYQQTKLNDTKS